MNNHSSYFTIVCFICQEHTTKKFKKAIGILGNATIRLQSRSDALQIAFSPGQFFVLIGGNALIEGKEINCSGIEQQQRDEDRQRPISERRCIVDPRQRIQISKKTQEVKNRQHNPRPSATAEETEEKQGIQADCQQKARQIPCRSRMYPTRQSTGLKS